MKLSLLAALLATLTCTALQAAETNRDEHLKWFDEARFGMFIHWGVYAVPAGEWKGKTTSHLGEWIMLRERIPAGTYKAFAESFTAAKYDPAAWARLAKEAGMKYVVITSKHHDGFALYDSAVTDWDVMNSGAKRDLLAPLAKAVRAEGLKFGLYYSQSQDWNHPGGAMWTKEVWDPAQKGNYDDYLKNTALPQVKEIVEKFDPAIIWWDTPTNMTKERAKPFADYITQFSHIINNDRLGTGFGGDTRTPEQNIPPRGYPGQRFEVCMTLNNTWGFKVKDTNWKSLRTLLRNLSDISSKGGNFLLNVGPTAEGVIPPESVALLQGIGRWMKVNSEAIYGTTASPFRRRLPWGRVTQKVSAAGTTLFVHVWEWPSDGQLLLPTVQETPSKGKLLANGADIPWKNTPDGLLLQLPKSATDPDVSVIRLDFPGPVNVTMAPFPQPDAEGRVTFTAKDADAYGHYDENIQLRDSGTGAFLTDWKSPNWRLEYHFKAPQAQKWSVRAEVATPDGAKLTLRARKSSLVTVEPTGPGLTWKSVTLGTIKLPAGETRFEMTGVPDGWKGLSVRNVWLEPAPADSPDDSIVRPDERGALILTAADAELEGNELRIESDFISHWRNPNDKVQWRAAPGKTGSYTVRLEYACKAGSQGSQYEITLGSQRIQGEVKATGPTWSNFTTEELGRVDLEKTDSLTIRVRALTKPGEGVMNLRALTLTPKDPAP